jgi:hypothetical protein
MKHINIKFKFDNNPPNSIYFIENYIDSKPLLKKLLDKSTVKWHTHTIIENPESIELFNDLINKISKDFNITPIKTRVNYFEKKTIKKYHKDFYKQDLTIVLNIHPGRILFKQDNTDTVIDCHLEQNTLYIFDKFINTCWMHQVETIDIDRISIVTWAKCNNY